MDIKEIQAAVNDLFFSAFGRTPLTQRLRDIDGEHRELQRWTDLPHLREETGDLLASLVQLCNECDWSIEELIAATAAKIRHRQVQYHSLGRKINVAIYGGAFDPVTVGHIQVAQYVLDASRGVIDEIWLTPCFKHLHGKRMAPAEARLRLCNTAIRRDGRLKLFDYEVKNELAGDAAELNHPRLTKDGDGKDYSVFEMNLAKICALVEQLRFDGNNLYCKMRVCDQHPAGMMIKALVDEGYVPGFSLRGAGSVVEASDGVMEIADDYRLITIDVVGNPSFDETALIQPAYESIISTKMEVLTEAVNVAQREFIVNHGNSGIVKAGHKKLNRMALVNLMESIDRSKL